MHAGRNNLYDATIRRMVKESLEQKEAAFYQTHENDTDEELLLYLRQCYLDLGHSPHEREIIGGTLITSRFGFWTDALTKAGLPMPSTPDKISRFVIYKNEEVEQQRIYREKKAEKKRRAQIRQAEREAKAKTADQMKRDGGIRKNHDQIMEEAL